MLSYPVRLIPGDDGSVTLTVIDIPEVVVVGADEDEVFRQALPQLETVLAGYVVEGRALPAPSDICAAPTVTTTQFSVLVLDLPT